MEAVYGYSVVNYLKPGTTEFNELKGHITSTLLPKAGADSTTRVHCYSQGERTFDTDAGQFRGGNVRLAPNSAGTIFSDTGDVVIRNYEAGIYGGWEQFYLDERQTLHSPSR